MQPVSLYMADLRHSLVLEPVCGCHLININKGFVLLEQIYQSLPNKIRAAFPWMKIPAPKDIGKIKNNEINVKVPEIPEQGTHKHVSTPLEASRLLYSAPLPNYSSGETFRMTIRDRCESQKPYQCT